MDNKTERELKEYLNLFSDPKYAKRAWQKIIGLSLVSHGKPLPQQIDKDGNETLNSMIDHMAYDNVKMRLFMEGVTREPMQAELAVECNVIRMRFSDAAFVNMRDSTGAKPTDKFADDTGNPYESMSDEELEILQEFRAKRATAKSTLATEE